MLENLKKDLLSEEDEDQNIYAILNVKQDEIKNVIFSMHNKILS